MIEEDEKLENVAENVNSELATVENKIEEDFSSDFVKESPVRLGEIDPLQSTELSIEGLMNQLKIMVDSRLLPEHIYSVETAFTVFQLARELGIPTMVAFNSINVIKGKLTLPVKIQTALVRRAKHHIYYSKHGEYMYNIEGKVTFSKYFLFPRNSPEHEKSYMGIISEVTAERIVNGRVIKQVVDFTTLDAQIAGYVEKNPTWLKLPKEMTASKAMAKMINILFSDISLGMMSTEEWLNEIGEEVKFGDE